jgi:hypothetical protein
MTDIRALIADDAFAASFQSLGQYRTALLAALAQPEPQGPTDEELSCLRAFPLRIYRVATPCYQVEEYKRELDFARAALAQPEPQGPTDEEIDDWHGRCADLTRVGEADHYWAFDLQHDEVAGVVRAALARWGRPAIEPVP